MVQSVAMIAWRYNVIMVGSILEKNAMGEKIVAIASRLNVETIGLIMGKSVMELPTVITVN